MGRKKNKPQRQKKIIKQMDNIPMELQQQMPETLKEEFLKQIRNPKAKFANLSGYQIRQSTRTCLAYTNSRNGNFGQVFILPTQESRNQLKHEVSAALQQIGQEYLKELKEIHDERTKFSNYHEIIRCNLAWSQKDFQAFGQKVTELIKIDLFDETFELF